MTVKNRSRRATDGDNAYLHIDYEESKSTAVNCIRFIECLPVPSGALAGEGKLIKLMPWQKELIRGIWHPSGMRNEVLLSIARRNGKTVTLAAIMTFLLFNTHASSKPYPGSLMVSAACNKEQAGLIFDLICLWCSTVIELDEASEITHYHKAINVLTSKGTKFKSISANARSALGGQYSAVICDETSFWRDNKLQLALRHGMASTPPSHRLFLQASTVPDQENHFFYDELRYFAKNKHAPNHYALVCMTDPRKDPPNSEKTWKKSNPSYGVLVHRESFVDEYRSAKNFPARMSGFVSYRCNAPCAPLRDDSARFISKELWASCKNESKLIDGEQIVVAWDAATTQDLTAVVALSVDRPHRSCCWFIVPPAALEKNPNIPYRQWADAGYCVISESQYVSKQRVIDVYKELQERYDVIASMSDLFGYAEIKQLAESQGIDLTLHTARNTRYADYNDGLDKLSEIIRTKQLYHDNPLLTYCVSNLRITRSRSGATIVDRALSTDKGQKIDGAISLMLCSLLVASTTSYSMPIDFSNMIIR